MTSTLPKLRARLMTAVAATALAALISTPQASADDANYLIYVHGYLSDGIVGYHASDTGQPIPVPGRVSSGLPNWPEAASVDGRFLYVAPTLNPRLVPYAIGADGVLSPAGAALPLPDVPVDIAFAPNGVDGYVVVGALNGAVVPVRLGDNGIPYQNGPVRPLGSPMDGLGTASVSPDGRNLYVASAAARELVVLDINSDGTLAPAKQRMQGGINPLFPTLTPDGRHVFITNELSGTVSAFNRADDGSLAEAPGSPFAAGLLPHVPSMSPDGRYLYVPNTGSSFVSSYAIEPNGSLRPLPNVEFLPGSVGVYTESSVISPSGDALWVLGTDPMRGGEEVLRRFFVGADGTLSRDDSFVLYPGTVAADGRTMTLVAR